MRRLIVNADDFGLTRGVNRAIAEGHTHGIVSSATLMACSTAFDDAVRIAKANPELAVGCHTLLIDGEPLTDCASLRVDSGRFRTGVAEFAHAAIRNRLVAEEIECEAAAQLRKLQQAGIQPTHLDSHKHTHMFPPVLRPLLRAARAAGVKAIRNPFVPAKALAWAHLARRPRLWVRYAEVRVLRRFMEAFHCAVREAGLKTTQGTFGVLVTGSLDERLFAAILGNIPEGTWELVCHPGYNDPDLDGVATRLRSSREVELRLLTSPAARQMIERAGIQLITYRDL